MKDGRGWLINLNLKWHFLGHGNCKPVDRCGIHVGITGTTNENKVVAVPTLKRDFLFLRLKDLTNLQVNKTSADGRIGRGLEDHRKTIDISRESHGVHLDAGR